MNWNKIELNGITELSDLKGKTAFDKFNEKVVILEAFRNPNKLSTATIMKKDKQGRIKIIDIPLCALRIVNELEPDYKYREDQCKECKNNLKCKFRESYCSGESECPQRYHP